MTDEIKELKEEIADLKMEIRHLENDNNNYSSEVEDLQDDIRDLEDEVRDLERQLLETQFPIPNNTLEDSLKIELLNEYWDSINYLSLRDYLQNTIKR